jgi:hypothetical protein
MNLGLLDPVEVVERVERAYRAGEVPLASAEGFVRQVIGWRDYVWHLYWHLGDDYRTRNALGATTPVPQWFWDLDADAVEARCLSDVLRGVKERGWVHHIPRLMVLGNFAMQRGWDPREMTEWFHRSFVDGYDWVMVPNVVGMSQHADGGIMATKPYAGGGAYIDKMSDYCKPCVYDPKVRVGERACPYTAGYWWFIHRNRDRLALNHRMAQAVRGLDRLRDVEAVVEQEAARGSQAPDPALAPAAHRSHPDRPACGRRVDYLAALRDLGLAGRHQAPGGRPCAVHQRSPVVGRHRTRRLRRAHRCAGRSPVEQVAQGGLEGLVGVGEPGPSAGRRAVAHLLPVALPLAAPGDRASAHGARLGRQVRHRPVRRAGR